MIPRAYLRRSAAVARGFAAGLSGGRLTREWYEAQAAHEEEVDELQRRADADRAAADWLRGRR